MKLNLIFAIPLLAACAQPLTDYRPVVDPAQTDAAKYEADRTACLAIAESVQKEYRRRATEQAFANALAGALLGAAVGASVDGVSAGDGAVYGSIAGPAAGSDYGNLVRQGPRRVVDRCMNNRGHRILADIGRS